MKITSLLILCIALSVGQACCRQVASFKTSDGETLFYTKTGKGPKVVLLYGGPGLNSGLMRPWADSLASRYESILFEQRGTGLSANARLDSTTINLKRAVQDIEELRSHLGEEQLILCGHSWGGALAQAYASFFPEHVKKIVLVSALGPDLSLVQAFGENIQSRTYPAETDSLVYWSSQPANDKTNVKALVFQLLPYFFDHEAGYKTMSSVFSTPSPLYNPQMSGLMMKDLLKGYDLKPALKNYKGQCIIIKPRQDVIPEETVYQVKEILPQTKIFTIERSGHFPDWEQPAELYKILRRVL